MLTGALIVIGALVVTAVLCIAIGYLIQADRSFVYSKHAGRRR